MSRFLKTSFRLQSFRSFGSIARISRCEISTCALIFRLITESFLLISSKRYLIYRLNGTTTPKSYWRLTSKLIEGSLIMSYSNRRSLTEKVLSVPFVRSASVPARITASAELNVISIWSLSFRLYYSFPSNEITIFFTIFLPMFGTIVHFLYLPDLTSSLKLIVSRSFYSFPIQSCRALPTWAFRKKSHRLISPNSVCGCLLHVVAVSSEHWHSCERG